MGKGKKKWKSAVFFVLVLALWEMLLLPAFAKDKAEAEDKPKLYARSALLMDAQSGRVLLEQNGYEVLPMASTTKILTCILALEYMQSSEYDESRPVTVSGYAASMPKVKLGMQKGEEYALKDLLYSLMLESHNDTAVAIAEYIDGSVEAFSDRMNQKAVELGCKDSCFLTPNGLDSEMDGKVHSTTAYDLALIASYAVKNSDFREVIGTRQYAFSEQKSGRSFTVYNHNQFLDQMEGAFGIKTGFTNAAGYCFVGALEQGGRTYIGVLLGCGWPPNKGWKWTDIRKLMEYGLANYEMKCIRKEMDLPRLFVEDGVEELVDIKLIGEEDDELTTLLSHNDSVEVKLRLKKKLKAPAMENTLVGRKEYYINGELYRSYEIRLAKTVKQRTYYYCMRQIFMLYF